MEHSKVFSAIQAAYPKLTAAERSVADFFLQNRERGDFSSKAVAARLYVSEASSPALPRSAASRATGSLSTSTSGPLTRAAPSSASAR